jgi:LysR family transcriptional regulator, glycine cleavage system transcriptional activator
VLRLSVLPTISFCWLMPRLAAFSQQEHGTEVRMINSIEPVDFQAKGIDLAIRVGRVPGETYGADNPRIELEMVTDWRGVRSEPLFRDVLTPVCAPALIAERPLETVADLSRHRLIHMTTRRYAWHDWLRAHGAAFDPDGNALYFGHFFMAMAAARAGEGIAIVPTVLLRQDDSGLVRPFAADLPSAGHYYLLSHKSRAADPKIRRFTEWILREAALETPLPAE